MEYVVGGVVGLILASAAFGILLGGADALRARLTGLRGKPLGSAVDVDQRLAEHLAVETGNAPRRVRPAGRADPMSSHLQEERDEDPPLYRTAHGNRWASEHRWDPYAPTQSRVYRVRAARRRAKTGTVNLYALLDVAIDASDEDIRQAYRQQVSRIHPDKFQGDPRKQALAEQRLRQLNHAVQVLRDPARRARHDAALQI